MATMIPDIMPETIENRGERYFYEQASNLPDHYTVMYSYKFSIETDKQDPYGIREADFVIVHPNIGFVVVEVKQGQVQYHSGVWQEQKDEGFVPMYKNPVDQAQTAMFAILQRYKKVTKEKKYPLQCRYAVCFPDTTKKMGVYPENLHEESCWTLTDIDQLEESIKRIFSNVDTRPPVQVTNHLISKVLAPSFRVFSSIGDQLDRFQHESKIILTEEQERILEETEEDHRKIFFGAAGTGKTFIAMKKAIDLAKEGKKVLLTCYNKHLVRLFEQHCTDEQVIKMNFHQLLEKVLLEHGYDIWEPKDPQEANIYYQETLPNVVYDLYASLPDEDKFDAIIVDEGQDFKESWYLCMEEMVKEDGYFYIFADRHQNLFGNGLDALKDFQMSKHRLTINLRNTQRINEWASPFIRGTRLRYRLHGGDPVEFTPWKTKEEEKRLIEKAIRQMVSQGLSPHRITILSPHRKEKSCLKDKNTIGEWPLVDIREGEGYGVQFCTIRAFKGLEADVVLLIGIKNNSQVCTLEDIYVGGTRARFMLKLFHHEEWSYENFIKEPSEI